ncbi:hypothetical protein V502_10831 [Pseudogymnoascus sp. VKM F-4520 (FW-2644)]|nr:hypothetical protein V502_10831 [Pseudogymnoascus sp. VKM F-4520 (FW-2644)]
MDETGFAKITPGKQERITVIECVNAAGGALSLMVIFKAKDTNSRWIPENAPANWQFSTSSSGWTSNSYGLEWLRTVFEPESRQKSGDKPRLLIADGHASHITANMIALLLKSSPPDGTELRAANAVFNSVLDSRKPPATPTRRYATRVTQLLERQNSELIVIRKELEEQRAILKRLNTHKKGKRVRLQGEFVFSTADVLKIAQEAEEKPVAKRPRGRPRKWPIEEVEEEEEEELVLSSSTGSDSEGSVIVVHSIQSRAM